MKLDTLIAFLQKVRAAKGNVDVFVGAFCGTNNGHAAFGFKAVDSNPCVTDYITGDGRLSLTIELLPESREQILKGIKDMERLGHTYYRSQFVETGKGERPRPGLSPCDWHSIW